ncbi:MAG: Com family DNA-binding transcriptional regulator [Brachymonas sp.]
MTKTQDIRCIQCSRKLAEGLFVRLSIKCPRCRAVNDFSTERASERLSTPKGSRHDANSSENRPVPGLPGQLPAGAGRSARRL